MGGGQGSRHLSIGRLILFVGSHSRRGIRTCQKPSDDSPDSARACGELNSVCEVDSLISYDGEGLEEYVEKMKGKVLELPFYLKKE